MAALMRLGVISVLAVLVVGLAATAAGAAPPAGTPNPSAIVLTSKDFATGAKDIRHTVIAPTGSVVAGYVNEVQLPAGYGASKYVEVTSSALVASSAAAASTLYAQSAHKLSQPALRKSLIKALTKGLKTGKVTALKPRAIGGADSSMELGLIIRVTKSIDINVSFELLRVDRVIVENIAIGDGTKVSLADAKALTTISAGHAGAVLVPIAIAAPAVTGTPQQGQTLTASTGTWGDSPATYGYQWQDCDSAGANCAPIAGATAQTYEVQPTDVAHTLRAEVTATNRFGSAVAESAVTAAAS
jgi:hypothetical protein